MQHIHTDPILLNPGPVNVSERVRRAMCAPDMCHREPEFSDLHEDVRRKLLNVYGLSPDEFSAVLISGSGTAAVESAVCGAVGRDERLLVMSNGVYGERMAEMARIHGIEYEAITSEWGALLDAAALDERLAAGGVAALALVHHETTTGVLNDVAALAQIASRHGVRTIVDAVSSFAGEFLDFTHLGFVTGTSNKCIHGIPGISFVILNRSALSSVAEYTPRSLYLDLRNYAEAADAGVPAFTPAIPALYVLNEALDELLEEGLAARIELYRKRSSLIRDAAQRSGYSLFCDPIRMGSSLTSIMLPPGLSYEALHDRLKADGFVIYAGQGGLRVRLFRIANMGSIAWGDLERLGALLEDVIHMRDDGQG
ncbi:MAG: aminotransferase class V-fold PLP-dependent enzyme [Verrucomicrobia bacterium]|nr:aminotransferase class V-fold PLP-dependent enzyme [Verrucomicrobiota bacterium]